MKNLRIILLIFGWSIPITVVLGAVIGIFNLYNLASIRSQAYSVSEWQILGVILNSFRSLALSPLCFFAAYLLKEKTA